MTKELHYLTGFGGQFETESVPAALPKGRFTVKIRKTFAGGAVKNETRRYRTCVPKARS